MPDPLVRFTHRAAVYDKGRPTYPGDLLGYYRDVLGLGAGARVADVGAGTGIHAGLLAGTGARVYAVEPNVRMRAIAEARFRGSENVRVTPGSAEDTGLDLASVDGVFAAQAFHWFEPDAFALECGRVIVPGGYVALVWNVRDPGGGPFTEAYEAHLHRWGVDYGAIRAGWGAEERIESFFGLEPERSTFRHDQELDREELFALAASSSYMPRPGGRDHDASRAELEALFTQYVRNGRVTVSYETLLFHGPSPGPERVST